MAGDHCEPDMAIADQVRTSLVLIAAFTGLLEPLRTTSKDDKKGARTRTLAKAIAAAGATAQRTTPRRKTKSSNSSFR
jgi:hypothetical protein